MASLGSRIKSAAKKVSSKLSSQAKALTSSITKNFSPSSSSKPNMTSVVTGRPANSSSAPRPNQTSVVTGRPASPTSAPKAVGTSVATGRATSSTGSPRPNMTSASTGQPTYGAQPKRSSGGGGSNRSLAGSAYDALRSALGGGNTRASDGGPGVSGGYTPEYDTYKGNTGTTQRSYTPGQGQSLEAQALGQPSPTSMSATPDQRAGYRSTIGTYESGAAERDARKQALQAQIASLQAAVNDATAAATVADPLAAPEQSEEDMVAQQIKEMEREMEELTRVPEEVLAAQREEERLLAEEARIKDEMNKQLYGIKGQAIPQGFITGQGARVQDLANVGLDRIAGQKMTLQQKLANAQERRAAALDVVRSKSNRLYDRQDTLDSRKYDEKKRKEEGRYITLSDGAQVYDTVTGKIVENVKNYAPKASSNSGSEYASGGADTLPRGTDGYVDPYEYARLRANAKSATEFDRKYSYLVNPVSKYKFGLETSGA